MKEQFSSWIKEIQDSICHEVEKADGKEKFMEDKWSRPEGGGGITRVIQNGAVFEKGGVNISEVYGPQTPKGGFNSLLTPALSEGEGGKAPFGGLGAAFFACGISLVLHPRSPMVPAVHANYRYFEVYDKDGNVLDSWFGGGADLTPYYLFEEDAVHFHKVHKASCDKFQEGSYQLFKKQCDDYFVNTHRNNERRGIGGIFYDYLKPTTPVFVLAPSPSERAGGEVTAENLFAFAQSNAQAFIDAYFPLVEKRKNLPYSEAQKHWQLIRRGRYVEFNLIHDRGTIFGLKSNGRTESILMSLPPEVRFEYDYKPKPNSEEDKLQQILLNPKDWI
jgi:coproporphyrinogen III oxidase